MSRPQSLVDDILEHEVGYPIEAMEKLIGCGEEAVPAAGAVLAKDLGSDERDVLPLVVVLGEVGGAAAVGPLAGILQRGQPGEILLDAAAHALAKAGAAAVPELVRLSGAEDADLRFWAAGALSWTARPESVEPLRRLLRESPELCGLAASGLALAGDKDSLEAVYRVYRGLPDDHIFLSELEEAMLRLAGRPSPPEPEGSGDWRVRWRRRPGYGWGPAPSPLVAAHVLLEARDKGELPERKLEKKSLEALLAAAKEPVPVQPVCPDCGQKLLRPTGVPVCPESAYGAAVIQAAALRRLRASGLVTIPRALDELDADVLLNDEEWQEWHEQRKERWLFQQETLEALMVRGDSTLAEGLERVEEARKGLGALWGLPQSRLESDEDFEAEFFA